MAHQSHLPASAPCGHQQLLELHQLLGAQRDWRRPRIDGQECEGRKDHETCMARGCALPGIPCNMCWNELDVIEPQTHTTAK